MDSPLSKQFRAASSFPTSLCGTSPSIQVWRSFRHQLFMRQFCWGAFWILLLRHSKLPPALPSSEVTQSRHLLQSDAPTGVVHQHYALPALFTVHQSLYLIHNGESRQKRAVCSLMELVVFHLHAVSVLHTVVPENRYGLEPPEDEIPGRLSRRSRSYRLQVARGRKRKVSRSDMNNGCPGVPKTFPILENVSSPRELRATPGSFPAYPQLGYPEPHEYVQAEARTRQNAPLAHPAPRCAISEPLCDKAANRRIVSVTPHPCADSAHSAEASSAVTPCATRRSPLAESMPPTDIEAIGIVNKTQLLIAVMGRHPLPYSKRFVHSAGQCNAAIVNHTAGLRLYLLASCDHSFMHACMQSIGASRLAFGFCFRFDAASHLRYRIFESDCITPPQ